MTRLLTINRRTWLALWAQDRRRRRQHRLLPAPVLRAAYPDLLQWDWDLPDPYKWNVWMSLDGGASWIFIEDYWAYGAARQFAPDGGSELYYIVGVDAAGVEITERSNWIRPDDAMAPVPQTVMGLQLWVRMESLGSYADSEPVATWPDESGHAHDLTQVASESQPTFAMSTVGQPSVYFDGLDDVLVSASSVFTTDEHTIFIVARPDATGECDLLGTGNVDTGDVLMMLYGDYFRGHVWRTGELNVLDSMTSINTTSLAIFEQRCSDTDFSLHLSGGLEATQTVAGTPTAAVKPVRLGSRDMGANFNGHILAVLVYDRALTELEAETVRQYLTTTYNVPTPYSAGP
jgi:hypothetical protein